MEEDFHEIREGVQAVCDRFGDDYWLARDEDGVFPHEFHGAIAEAGWLGITMPEEYGGAGLGVSDLLEQSCLKAAAQPGPKSQRERLVAADGPAVR